MFSKSCQERIEREYQELLRQFPKLETEFAQGMEECDEEEKLALKYLYGHMPLSDVGNYDCEVMKDFAIHGVRLWKNPLFREEIPEDIFLNYVLYHRVHSESIEPCRSFFYEKLEKRIRGLDMREAALEANYWCAEEATYKSTDGRTLSAMGVYRNVFGRCGEESVFTVNVMRSIGIPARQVYVPWWSHCDDNHAWVEIWCAGAWHFLGACEPEPILDKGWFNDAASRAMIVHSRWFDTISAHEDIVGKVGMVTLGNQINRYAFSKRVKVTVQDQEKRALAGAEVHFQVLNYAGLCDVAVVETDREGVAWLQTGYGDLWIEVYKDGKFAETLLPLKETSCTLILGMEHELEKWDDFDMTAPVDAPMNKQQPTPDQKAEAAIRYQTTVEKRSRKCEALRFEEIEQFEKKHQQYRRLTEAFLASLSEKDLRDGNCAVLEEHYQDALCYLDAYWKEDMRSRDYEREELFVNYIMNPRIHNEMLKTWRKAIRAQFSEIQVAEFREDPRKIWAYIEETIKENPEKEHRVLVTTPAACLKLGVGSRMSRKTLFVAVARTFGIPARLNPMDCAMEYWKEGAFVAVEPEKEKTSSIRVLAADDSVVWNYEQNWSIAKEGEQGYQTLDLSGEKVAREGCVISVEPGRYRLITANRLPNGNVFAKRYLFDVTQGEEKQVTLHLRDAELGDMMENIKILPFNLKDEEGRAVEAAALTEGEKKILFWLEEAKEPTEHILNELFERRTEFKKYEGSLIFVLRNQKVHKNATIARSIETFPRAAVYYDDFMENVSTLGRRMYVDPEKLPLIVVTCGSLNGVYATSGYNVGTADLLLRILKMEV
ncbi:MAG: transglutaminase-like domain-containing protein [Lachnospiraceae bacterium]|nr:transglutaminase-like domain-containing protein [Lachnospiraceae bacterium]